MARGRGVRSSDFFLDQGRYWRVTGRTPCCISLPLVTPQSFVKKHVNASNA
jgi:hypothetical protein